MRVTSFYPQLQQPAAELKNVKLLAEALAGSGPNETSSEADEEENEAKDENDAKDESDRKYGSAE